MKYFRLARYLGICLIICLLSNCIPSLHPLYTDNVLVFDDLLLGSFESIDEEIWVFEKRDEKSYSVIISHEESEVELIGHLVKLGDNYFMDFYPKLNSDLFSVMGEKGFNFWYDMHFVPCHTFSKIILNGNSLQINLLNNNWFVEIIEAGYTGVKYEYTEDEMLVLTSSSIELQEFVKLYANDEDAFPETLKLERKL
ncbi:MAG: hypothetical protein IIA45_00645 [Bacteroidetes bacterium]|nr:hypothetical protein [Bacteroidota bacterium]